MVVLLGLGLLSISYWIRDVTQRDSDSDNMVVIVMVISFSYWIPDVTQRDSDSDNMALFHINIYRSYLISALFVNTIMAIFSALMLYGVNKKKANFMTPYIYVMLIMIGLAMYMIGSMLGPTYPIIGGIVGGFSLLEFYFIRVVKLHKDEVSFS